MKRLEFVKTISLATIGLSLFPSWVSKNKTTIKLLPFPKLQEHVRHSGFEKVETKLGSSPVSFKSREILFKNGFDKGEGDLTITSLEFKGKRIDVFYSFKGVSVSVDSTYSELKTSTKNIDGTNFSLIEGKEITIKNETDLVLVLPLAGHLVLNGNHEPEHAVLLKNIDEQCFRTSSSGALHLVIS